MGQKTNPIGLRLGITRSWNSKWFATKNFSKLLLEDVRIKRYIHQRLENAGIASVEILRAPKRITIDIHTSRPGIVIGRKGIEVDKLREELRMIASSDITLNIIEVKKPELSARLVGESIARQLEGRMSFRRVMKKALSATMKIGAEGIKITCAGRLNGAEIARSEKYKDGRVPLHTLRADIDYATSTAHTTYGTIGVKVWICRGEMLDRFGVQEDKKEEFEPRRARQDRGPKRQRPRARGRVRKARPRDGQGGPEQAPRGEHSGPRNRPQGGGEGQKKE